MPRRAPIDYDFELFVKWNAQARRFDIQRSDGVVSSSAVSKMSAIKLAANAAQFECRDGKKAAVYSFDQYGKLIVEWSA